MTITVLLTQELTASGNITIPAGCENIHALVIGSQLPPSINGATMGFIASLPETTKVKAISCHQYQVTQEGTVPFVKVGDSVSLIYSSGSGKYRDAVLKGTNTTQVTGDLISSSSDLVIAVLSGMIGPTVLSGDTVPFTYIRNDTFYKTGHITPGDSLLSCIGSDSGVSSGYTIDGGSITHPAVLVTAGYYSFDPVWHAQYYQWEIVGTGLNEHWEYVYHPAYYTYEANWHDPVYTEEWEEELPDTVIPGGENATVSALFVSLQLSGSYEWVPKVICG